MCSERGGDTAHSTAAVAPGRRRVRAGDAMRCGSRIKKGWALLANGDLCSASMVRVSCAVDGARRWGRARCVHQRRTSLVRCAVCVLSFLLTQCARFVSVLLLSRLRVSCFSVRAALLRRASLVHSCSFTKGTKRRTKGSQHNEACATRRFRNSPQFTHASHATPAEGTFKK
jgi:hypothetical protein